jgi:hypothetical protein
MRGTGSLQQLLGRSSFTSSLRKRKAENVEASTSGAVENSRPSSSSPPAVGVPAATSQKPPTAQESPLKAGFVRCPVCQKQLEHRYGDEFINSHLGKQIQ